MKITERCFDCLLSRIKYNCDLICTDPKKTGEITEKCRNLLTELCKRNEAAPKISSRVHRLAYEEMGSIDPYKSLKEKDNSDARDACEKVITGTMDFRDLCLAAIIGNTLDYGSKEHAVTQNLVAHFSNEFEKGLTIDDTEQILGLSDRVVFFCDNCGEIIFDSYLIRFLKEQGSHITVVVRGGPIINDATLEDAHTAGIDAICDALLTNTNGVAELGYNPDLAPEELLSAIASATIIIAKGMANYESLTEIEGLPPVAYCMTVKCIPIADSIGVQKGSRIAMLTNQ
ncbi:ARMT1-like domain-containing protein [Methanogenium sp. S4BF]|uniref:damage-control phosphatase ARMT1 family protein n=1 Tax=Methanogenium sp. S4BF TaxID=1789226 RepID=UPI002415B1EC|nr:ARMT1-like domain-containing protein [Methanogenium sp. S4BF]WFN34808.1 ARMT1-like domain-containing protein [Methanogenium sp. S4BF]